MVLQCRLALCLSQIITKWSKSILLETSPDGKAAHHIDTCIYILIARMCHKCGVRGCVPSLRLIFTCSWPLSVLGEITCSWFFLTDLSIGLPTFITTYFEQIIKMVTDPLQVKEGQKIRSFSTPKGMMTIAGLEILNVTQADGGTYSVKATNRMGEANANINLNFSSMCEH